MEIKSFPAEFKADVEEGVFEGYASVFGNLDSWNDIVERGAFKKTLQENGHRVKVLWQHDLWTPIGKPIHMEEDSKGLFTKTKVAPTQQGKDALILIREGVINELSIGYDPIKWSLDQETNVRRLREVKLHEYSVVTIAANELARVTGVKQLDELRPLLAEIRGLQGLTKHGQRLSKTQLSLVEETVSALKALLAEFKGDPAPVIVFTRSEEQVYWVCPHCKEEIREKTLVFKDENYFHRCKESLGSGRPIALPKSFSPALLVQLKGDVEPGEPTPAPASEPKVAPIESSGKPAEGHSLAVELSKAVEPLSSWAVQQRILAELRGFGKSLKGAS